MTQGVSGTSARSSGLIGPQTNCTSPSGSHCAALGAARPNKHATITTDTWNILELAQQDPGNSSRIIDVYKNASYAKVGAGNSFYNREHPWPKSYGFPNDGGSNYPYSDCHVLFLCDSSYNSSRGNKIYDTVAARSNSDF